MAMILLVEDHPMNRKLVRDILLFQFEVAEAVSAEAAVEYLQTHHPDLILMDIQLPGMDGLTLTRRLKADPITADIPIVGLSAHAMRHATPAALRLRLVARDGKSLLAIAKRRGGGECAPLPLDLRTR